MPSERLAKQVAARGKYAPLYHYLCALDALQWSVTFADIESVLGFTLPDSARIHRPWWANQVNGSHSHALAWQAAGWRTSAVDLQTEALVFQRLRSASATGQPALSIEELFPPHGFGSRSGKFTASREQIYGDEGR